MPFPIDVVSKVKSPNGDIDRNIVLHQGFNAIVGPNGSGKTHLLRGLKKGLQAHCGAGKVVRFMSAGRLGPLENYRSDYDGQRGEEVPHADANFGHKGETVRRNKIETLNGDFQTLSERPDILIKIQERLRKLFRRSIAVDWEPGHLRVMFSRTDIEANSYSSGLEASGLLHLVGVLCAVYNDEIGVLLIDEPEVSLHPQLQAFLLEEMLSVAGIPGGENNKKIIVIATHSTEMIRLTTAADLPSIIFCYDLRTAPVQIAPTAGELGSKKIQALVARLGQEHKISLFSRRPLLVEGSSDSMICGAISTRLSLHLEAAGSQRLPVIGTGNMPVVTQFLRLLGKSPVVLADADAIADGAQLVLQYVANNEEAKKEALALGAASASELAKNVYGAFCQVVEKYWAQLAPFAEQHTYWVDRDPKTEIQLAKRRSAFGTLFGEDVAAQAAIAADPNWSPIKDRLSALLHLLEKTGCFILRRGPIEAYYKTPRPVPMDKIPWAADELTRIGLEDPAVVRGDYPEIVRCVEAAAKILPICEAETLRDLLLSIVSPALAKVQDGASTLDVRNLAKTQLGERSKLFILTVDSGNLVVTLESKILDVPGFPMTLAVGKDPIEAVNQSLGLAVKK